MLAATPQPELAYIWEPFSPQARPGICPGPFDRWFEYVTEENQAAFDRPVSDMLDYRYHPGAEIRSIRSPKDAGRLVRDWAVVSSRRRRRPIPLAEGSDRGLLFRVVRGPFHARVLVLIRHPAAFTNSLLAKGWHHPFGDFLAQPTMMRDLLEPIVPTRSRGSPRSNSHCSTSRSCSGT